MAERLLVIGCTGLLGRELTRVATARGFEVHGTFAHAHSAGGGPACALSQLLLEDGEAVSRLIVQVAPKAVVLSGGMTSLDECERRPRDAFDINVEGVMSVAKACKDQGAPLLFFSSDAVFGSHGDARLQEFDAPDPPSIYGKTKLEAERLVMDACHENLICRLGMLYGERPPHGRHNLASLVREECGAGRTVRVAIDHLTTPTYAPQVAAATIGLLMGGHRGMWHVCGPSCMSKYDFALTVAEVFGLHRELLLPVRSQEMGYLAPRSLRACMSNDKLMATLDVRMSPPLEGLGLLRGSGSMPEEGRNIPGSMTQA